MKINLYYKKNTRTSGNCSNMHQYDKLAAVQTHIYLQFNITWQTQPMNTKMYILKKYVSPNQLDGRATLETDRLQTEEKWTHLRSFTLQ